MLSKSFKIIAVGASFAGLVACGKGVGEKNNRVIDGTYVQAKTATLDGKVSELAQMVTIVDIKGGIRTQYRVNTTMRRVQITKDRLMIKGSSVIGIENIEDKCADQNELGLKGVDIRIGKNASGVSLEEEGKKTLLKPFDSKELAALLEQIQAKTYDVGCFDITGNKFTKLDEDESSEVTTAEEDKAKEEATKADEKEKSEEAAAIDQKLMDAPETEAAAQAEAAKEAEAKVETKTTPGISLRGQTVIP